HWPPDLRSFPTRRSSDLFTGDIHAVGAAHNLLAALIDNHMYQGNELDIDPKRVLWPRVMDMNDRQLRQVIVGLGGRADGVMRERSEEHTSELQSRENLVC